MDVWGQHVHLYQCKKMEKRIHSYSTHAHLLFKTPLRSFALSGRLGLNEPFMMIPLSAEPSVMETKSGQYGFAALLGALCRFSLSCAT